MKTEYLKVRISPKDLRTLKAAYLRSESETFSAFLRDALSRVLGLKFEKKHFTE